MGTVAILVAVALAIVLIAREASSRRALGKLRAEIDAVRADVRGQQQLANVGQLVSGLAQELKSPLQGVIGNAELMLASGTLGVESTSDLREIQENASRAAGLVRNLLAFTETADLTRRWQNINDLMDRAIAGIRTEFDASGVGVHVARAERLPLMYVDARQLEKVIATLLSRPGPRSAAGHDAASVALTVGAPIATTASSSRSTTARPQTWATKRHGPAISPRVVRSSRRTADPSRSATRRTTDSDFISSCR